MNEISKQLRATSVWWRPVAGWACTANVWLVLVVLPAAGINIPAEELYAMLAFDGLVIGLRGWEKLKASPRDPFSSYIPPGEM